MARPLRLSFENAAYHIMARGNRGESIFHSDRDKNVLIDKMSETFEKYSFICYAYCLMDNHYHLFLKTPFPNLTEGMHYLNASYANWFRARYRLAGAVFQGRYKSILVDEDSYALVLSAYIHLNPLRAGVVKHLHQYQWSSFLDYIGRRTPVIEKLDISFILNHLGNNLAQAQHRYKQFVMDNIKMENPLKDAFKGIAIGNEAFIEKVKEKIKSIGKNREIRETKFLEFYSADDIIRKISICFGIDKQDLFSKKRGNIYRQIALYLIKKQTPLSLKEIGNLFNMDYTAVSYAAKRFEKRLKHDNTTLRMLNKITQSFNSE